MLKSRTDPHRVNIWSTQEHTHNVYPQRCDRTLQQCPTLPLPKGAHDAKSGARKQLLRNDELTLTGSLGTKPFIAAVSDRKIDAVLAMIVTAGVHQRCADSAVKSDVHGRTVLVRHGRSITSALWTFRALETRVWSAVQHREDTITGSDVFENPIR